MSGTSTERTAPGVRDRLLDAADRLFYEEGIRAVGIDRVLAEAGAAKASLYSHFGCKDELVAAYIQRRVDRARAGMQAYIESVPPPDRALRVFDWVLEWTESEDFRGCPVSHVASELTDQSHPAHAIVADQRNYVRTMFMEFAIAAGVANAERTAGALVVLFDGAAAASERDGPERAREARWAAELVLARG
ncbi:MAG: TetR/AcrR family transcriptional regulator [Gemmatimonadaceae bacterium]